MTMASSVATSMSANEFWELPEQAGVRFELVDGEVIEEPGSSMRHAAIVALIFSTLRAFVLQAGLGQVFPDGLAYLLLTDPDTVRIPDVSFIPSDRLPASGPTEGYSTILPALAVEVVSPGNSALELRRRTRDYLEAGVSIVWVVWPEDRSISVYRGSMTPLELTADDALDGGDVLPGFSVTVAELLEIDW
jgi:Uma2 family endonuclease